MANCNSSNRGKCSDLSDMKVDVENFLNTQNIPFNGVNLKYLTREKTEILKIDISLEKNINNEGLLYYFLDLFFYEITREPECAENILITVPSIYENNGFLYKPTVDSNNLVNTSFKEFLTFSVKNDYSLILNSLDSFANEFNNSLRVEDQVNFENGFCGLVNNYLDTTITEDYTKFFNGLTVMLVFSRPNEYTKSLIDKVFILKGEKPNNWKEIESKLGVESK